MYHDTDLTPFSQPDPSRRSRLKRLALPLAVSAALAASAAAVAIAATSSTSSSPSAQPAMPDMNMGVPPAGGQASPSPYGTPQGGIGPHGGITPPSGGSAPAASEDLATYYGHQLAGNGQEALPLARVEALADQTPSGAQVDVANKTVRFTTRDVSLVVVASPPSGDMKFRTAGINDPTIEVPANAQVTLKFINGDSDMAHMWLLITGNTSPESFQPGGGGGGHLAAAPPLGDPTSAGQPAETISFSAPEPGTYHYTCPFPGHAKEGMYGRFVVQSS